MSGWRSKEERSWKSNWKDEYKKTLIQKTFDNLSLSMGYQDEKGLGEVEKSQTGAFKGSFILQQNHTNDWLISSYYGHWVVE